MSEKNFAIATTAAPLLNTPDFHAVFGGEAGDTIPLDSQGLLRAMETIALPGTKFSLLKAHSEHIFEVETTDYPDTPLFVDKRFLKHTTENTPERARDLPDHWHIHTRFKELVGLPYLWGGNWHESIPQMVDYYPPSKPFSLLDERTQITWKCEGVDCSGLLYLATNGSTPRNTSSLVHYGIPVLIEGLSIKQLMSLLKPLDLIVWKGHVVIVFDDKNTVESRAGHGVVFDDLEKRLLEILKERVPVNEWTAQEPKRFVVRRWHSQIDTYLG